MLFIKASLGAFALQFMDYVAVSPLRRNAKVDKYARIQNRIQNICSLLIQINITVGSAVDARATITTRNSTRF